MDWPEIDNFEYLFTQDVPLLDVRAPVEFAEGAFPQAQNLPLLNDEERHLIGIRYKVAGQEAAIELGRQLIDGQPRQERTENWVQFVEQNPDGVLYCFRGGMRSRIAQQWIYEATGIRYPRVKGGYKQLRQYLLKRIDQSLQEIDLVILGGRTGAGKTLVLQQLPNSIDLERLAGHRGSAFGHHAAPQPTQIDFENALSIEFIKAIAQGWGFVVLEDEGRTIGSRHLPPVLHAAMKKAPLVLLETSNRIRVRNSIDEYIHRSLRDYQKVYGKTQGFAQWSAYALDGLGKIRKRLGGARYKVMRDELRAAIKEFEAQRDPTLFKEWITHLLTEYYDPMYDFQLENKKDRVVFAGDEQQVIEYLMRYSVRQDSKNEKIY